jgi:carbon-monoxide dehydrogenase small subunit
MTVQSAGADEKVRVNLNVNGVRHELDVEPRRLLADVLRQDLALTAANIGCAHGVCGSCTVQVNGETVRSCLMFGVQADGAEIKTLEGVAPSPVQMHPIQEAFWEKQGLQCGYCTSGMILRGLEILEENPHPSRDEVREGIAGNICRCTGYQFIVDSILEAAEKMDGAEIAEPKPADGTQVRPAGLEDASEEVNPVPGQMG